MHDARRVISSLIRDRAGHRAHRVIRIAAWPVVSRIPKVHWSQSGEDIIIGALLPEAEGKYVDVGARDPREGSNTYLLYRRGWSGVCIEPNPESAARLRRTRPRDVVIEAAVGEAIGTTHLTIFFQDCYSTVEPATEAARRAQGLTVRTTVEVPVIQLRDLPVSATPQSPSLLSVDCEGSDLSVLKGINWDLYSPRVVCVEESAATLASPTEIRALLEGVGYRLRAHTGLSAIYVHQDWEALAD